MDITNDNYITKPINDIVPIITGLCATQFQHTYDVAIPFLVGKPGLGKTAIIYDICKKNNWNLMHLHFSTLPLERLGGLPEFYSFKRPDGTEVRGTKWTLPECITELDQLASEKDVILFLDDFHVSSPAHLALGYEMFTEYSIHGHKLPKNVAFILAGNTSSKAGSKTILSGIINRCCKLHVYSDFNQWKTNYAIPNGVNNKVISFLSKDQFTKYFHEEEVVNDPWASPRMWTRLSTVMNLMEENTKYINNDILSYICQGHVGLEATSQFIMYYNLYSKIEADLIIKNKKPIEIPNDISMQYTYIMATSFEYWNLLIKTQDQKTKELYINTMSDIIINMFNVNKEIAIAGCKELVSYDSVHNNGTNRSFIGFTPIIKSIMTKSPKTANEIQQIIISFNKG
jgi:hypothetical protein